MKEKHPFLYAVLRRGIVAVILVLLALTIFGQYSGLPISPEGIFAKFITPIQGIASRLTQSFSGYLYQVKLRSNIEYEYTKLKAENDQLVLRTMLYEELEKENTRLRALLGEFSAHEQMDPVLARVIASESGNYFSTFTINKGKKDGVDTQMAVISSEGLIGYTYEVFDASAKVISIIDDQASLAALIESSRDQGAVKGTLGTTGEALCRMYYLSADSVPRPGDRVITSGVGVSFPKGLLIGYVRESTRAIEDNKHYVVVEPAADFQHIEDVLVLRYYAEVEEMPDNYANTEVIIAPVATARPQAVIEEEKLYASTPVPLPDAPGRVTPTPAPEEVDFIIDEEAMGELADYFVQVTPTPEPTYAPTPTIDPDLIATEEDGFPEDF